MITNLDKVENEIFKISLLNYVHGQARVFVAKKEVYSVKAILQDFRTFQQLSPLEYSIKTLSNILNNYENKLNIKRPKLDPKYIDR